MQCKRSNKLHVIKPEEWLIRLRKIKDKQLRIKIACIVWWDFVTKKHSEEWKPIHDLVGQFKPAHYLLPFEAVERALVGVGYSVLVARIRSRYEPSSPVTVRKGQPEE